MRNRGFTGVHWLLMAGALAGTFSACRLNYETLNDDATAGAGVGGNAVGGDGAGGGVEAQGASANAGEGNGPGSGGDGSGTAGSATGGSSEGGAGVDPGGSGGSSGAGGTDTGGTAGSSGSGGSGGSPVGDLVVTTNADENDAGATALAPGGTGLSLREAIMIANIASGSQTITFQNGIVVAATSTLPTITEAVIIRGGEVNGAAVPNNRECMLIGAGPTTVDGLEIYGCRGRPIYVTGGNDVQITNCNLHQSSLALEVADTTGTGTIIGPNNTITFSGNHCVSIYNDNAQVIGNRISDCDSVGIFLSGTAANTRIVGNLILRSNFGISMASGTTGTVIWHNTVALSAASGLNVGQASPNDLRNNIFVQNGIYGVAASDARFTHNDYNLYFGNGSGACNPCMIGASSLQVDPLFTNAAGDDYTLQAGSLAINAGTPLGVDRNGAAAGDFNGVAPDIGYWESP